MAYELTFFDDYYFMKLKNRLKLFLLIWNGGKFYSDLTNGLELTPKESIVKYTQAIYKLGFLSIEEQRYNSSTGQNENYYFISDNDFNNIFVHMCEKAKLQPNPDAFELAYSERVKVYPLLDEKINNKIDFDESLKKKELLSILSKNLAFFFLFIMENSLKIKNNEFFKELMDRLTEDYSLDSHELYQFLSVNWFLFFR